MASEDVLLLCEYTLETHFGEDIVHPVGRLLIRGGALSISNIVERTGVTMEHATNVVTVLIKHNLLSAELNTFKNVHYYKFNQRDCLLRLSFPRYLALIASQRENTNTEDLVRIAIVREVFMAGSLLKSELVQLLARKKKRNATILAKVKSMAQLASLCQEACDELTLDHILVGVTQQSAGKTIDEEVKTFSGPKAKRGSKKSKKEEERLQAALAQQDAEAEAENRGGKNDAVLSEETPMRLNFAMLVAIERRDAIKALAQKKFEAPSGSNDENKLLEVVEAMFAIEAQSQNFLTHLSPQDGRTYAEKSAMRLQTITAQDLQAYLPGTSEAKISQALAFLSNDSSELVSKVSFDQQLQLGRYALNWQAAFRTVQLTLVDSIVAGAYGCGQGAHFCRVMRVLRQKGYMEEKELVKLTLLPQKNILAIVNRFMADGIVSTQEMPIKGGSSVGLTGGLLLYGVSEGQARKKMGFNLAKSVLNVQLATGGKLGRMSNLSLEMNHLLF